MKPDSSESLRKSLSAPVRILIEVAVTTGVILVLVLLVYHFFFSLSALIKKLRSPDPVVRLEGVRAASSFPSFKGTEEQERLAAELRTLLEKKTVREVKLAALQALFKQLSEKNVDTLAQHVLSNDYEVAHTALAAGMRHARLYPHQAWKIVAVFSVMTEKKPRNWPTEGMGYFLARGSLSSAPTTVDYALRLRYQGHDSSVPFTLCDYPCDVITGEKLDSETRTRLTLEAREFARKLELVE